MSTSMDTGCERCQCHGKEKQPAILYTLLSQELRPGAARQRCLCQQRRAVCLRTPHLTCQAASDVLVKTINFMKNVAAFHLLPREDQLLLLHGCWVPLFLLGLVQEMVTFEVMEAPAPSMLKKILLSGQSKGQEPEGTQPTLAAVQRLQWCLNSFWRLDLSPSEYTYLRGAILFNPGECQALVALLDTESRCPRGTEVGKDPQEHRVHPVPLPTLSLSATSRDRDSTAFPHLVAWRCSEMGRCESREGWSPFP